MKIGDFILNEYEVRERDYAFLSYLYFFLSAPLSDELFTRVKFEDPFMLEFLLKQLAKMKMTHLTIVAVLSDDCVEILRTTQQPADLPLMGMSRQQLTEEAHIIRPAETGQIRQYMRRFL